MFLVKSGFWGREKNFCMPPTIPFPGLVDMFSKVFVDAQVFGRIQMAFRDLCIYLHMCFYVFLFSENGVR